MTPERSRRESCRRRSMSSLSDPACRGSRGVSPCVRKLSPRPTKGSGGVSPCVVGVRLGPFGEPSGREVVPIAVRGFDEGDFFFAPPTLDLLLARNGRTHVRRVLVIHEAINLVALRETGQEFLRVFVKAAIEVVGDADLQRAGTVGEVIDVIFGHGAASVKMEGYRQDGPAATDSRRDPSTPVGVTARRAIPGRPGRSARGPRRIRLRRGPARRRRCRVRRPRRASSPPRRAPAGQTRNPCPPGRG